MFQVTICQLGSAIRQLLKEGYSLRDIAAAFGKSEQTIRLWLKLQRLVESDHVSRPRMEESRSR